MKYPAAQPVCAVTQGVWGTVTAWAERIAPGAVVRLRHLVPRLLVNTSKPPMWDGDRLYLQKVYDISNR
jgi:hypothetical protein